MTEDGRLQVRIAVTTGEALVTLGARPSEGEGMAAGDVVNTAARLQSAAPIDGILVDETTYRATRDVIHYEEADPVSAKGKAEPVPVGAAQAGILETDGSDAAEAKLAEMVGDLVAEGEQQLLESLRPLVGLAETGDGEQGADRSARFAAWRRLFESLSEHRPTVLVFEDLH